MGGLPLLRGLFRLLRNAIALALWPLWFVLRQVTRPRKPWVRLDLLPRLVEVGQPRSLFADLVSGLRRPTDTPIPDLVELVRHVVRDPRVQGLLVTIPSLRAGWASVATVRDLLESVRAANKKVVVFLPRGGGNKELWLASVADRVLITPQATFGPLGLVAELRYVRPLLDKLGLRVEVEARCEFKTAAEGALRDSMSEAQREQLTQLLGRVDTALREGLERRDVDVDQVLERALLTGQEAVEAKLADGIVYEDALPTEVTGEPAPRKRIVGASRFLDFHRGRLFVPLRRRYVAVVPVHGAITVEPQRTVGGRGSGADLETITKALRRAARDRRAVGVVLHVDSPGGSALASDLIHREIVACRRKKAVVACFANVAASGGYYVAAPCSAILAQPLTVTGSIGVIMARPVATDLLEKLGIRTETVRLAPHGDLLSPARALEDAERAILAREADGFYESFVRIVADGRERAFDDIEPLARGRIWAGIDARERGLIDGFGALAEAKAEVARHAGVPAAAVPGLESRVFGRSRRTAPPPLPPEAQDALALVPEAVELLRLCVGGDRALYFAAGLPVIR